MKTIERLVRVLGILALASSAFAQQPGIGRAEVLRHDVGATGREAIQLRVEFAPGAGFPKHTHPGEEIAYVLEGSLEYQLEGSAPVTLRAGESVFIPAGTTHSARNKGAGEAIELATYFVDKGRPLVSLKK